MIAPLACRQPFACSDTCHCTPDPGAIAAARFNANAVSRKEQARQGHLMLVAVWFVSVAALTCAVLAGPMRAEAQFQSDLRR